MDVYQTHGAFSWSELITSDPAAAATFYGKLFGWTFDTMPMPQGDYHVVKAADTGVGGIMAFPPESPPMPPHWGCYVTVNNVDDTLVQCASLGGATLVPATDVPGVGRMAVIKDPQGAVLNVMQYAQR
ncbi:MAG: VOC family protein [Chitinophagaceae bacterium]|nr:VOC family protein [Rubrivivax sp.]